MLQTENIAKNTAGTSGFSPVYDSIVAGTTATTLKSIGP